MLGRAFLRPRSFVWRKQIVPPLSAMSTEHLYDSMSWFERLFGFPEGNYDDTRSRFVVQDSVIAVKSETEDGSWFIGDFSVPSLKSLRDQTNQLQHPDRKLRLCLVVGDVTELLSQPENRWATFQVASQQNCLEFPSPFITPEEGIAAYDTDRTQGPACSVACGPATVYRNYFVPVSGFSGLSFQGQRRDAQINNADELLAACGEAASEVIVSNGYMDATERGLKALNAYLESADRQFLLEKLKIGVHADVQVTSKNWGRELVTDPEQLVTQVFCSACPVAYSAAAEALWEPISRLVLEAAYEATLRAAALTAQRRGGGGGSTRVYLTLLGGGVFGNCPEWIADAVAAALERCAGLDLDVRIVQHRGQPPLQLRKVLAKYGS